MCGFSRGGKCRRFALFLFLAILTRFFIAHSIAQMVPNRGISPENRCSRPKLSDSFQTGRYEAGSIRNPMLYPLELRALRTMITDAATSVAHRASPLTPPSACTL
jgi:hypothetical protein